MKTKSIFLLTFLLASCLASAQSYIPLQQHMQGVSGAEKITNLAEVEADLGRFTNLSATTGILSTANAQTLNVTGNATVNGFNYTASPTLNGASSTESTSTSVVGGIWNGDFSEGEGTDGTSFGWSTGSYGAGTSNTFLVSNNTGKLTAVGASDGSYYNYIKSEVVPITPSVTYKASAKYKIANASLTASSSGYVYLAIVTGVDSAATTYRYILANTSPVVNTDWQYVETTFTNTASHNTGFAYLNLAGYSATVYLDDIKLEQVTTHTNNSTTPTVAYPVITGVSSEFVGQQQTASNTINNFGGKTDGNQYWIRQTFTASEEKLSSVTFRKYTTTGSPVGNIILEIKNAAEAIIASVDVEKAVWDSYATNKDISVPLFAILEPGLIYSVNFRSDATESTASNTLYNIYYNSAGGYSGGSSYYSSNSGSSWVANAGDNYFKTHYAENTRQITLTNSNTGTSTTVDWGDDGLPDGAVVDLYNGTMSWDSGIASSPLFGSNLFTLITEADLAYSPSIPDINVYKIILNNWFLHSSTSHGLHSGQSTSASGTYIKFKIPSKYIDTLSITFNYNNDYTAYKSVAYYSLDNSNWTLLDNIYGITTSSVLSTHNISPQKKDYIYFKVGTTYLGYCSIKRISFTATIDTSAIAPLLLAAGSNTINQSVNGGSYKANVAIKSVSGGFQTTLNEANKQLTVLRNASRSYLETPDKTTNAIVVDNNELVSISGPVQVNGATIMNASTTPTYDIVLPYNSGGAIGSSWNTYSETKYKNIISDVTEASYANIASRLAGVQSKMVTRKIPDAVKAKFFDAEIEWVTDVVSVTEELKTQVVEPVYEVVKMDSKVTLDSKATEEQLLTAEADRKIVSYVTKEVSVLRSPGEYPRQEFRGWKIRQGVDEATKKQLENLYFKPHPEPIADTAPEAYRVPEGFAWSKWVEESTIYQNWILPQIINELPKLRKRLEALEAMEAVK